MKITQNQKELLIGLIKNDVENLNKEDLIYEKDLLHLLKEAKNIEVD